MPRSRGGQVVERGYEQSYQVTGGFFLWLESDPAPGIVKRINTAMRQRTYSNEIFQEATGKSIDELWAQYTEVRAEITRQEQARAQARAQEAEEAASEEAASEEAASDTAE